MNQRLFTTFLVLFVVISAVLARADNFTLTLILAPHGEYSPYEFTLTDTSTLQASNLWLVCGSYNNKVYVGESWGVQIFNINTVGGQFGASQEQWSEAAFFANLLLQNAGTSQLQEDVWGSLNLGGALNPSDHQFYENSHSGLVDGAFFIPIDGTQPSGWGIPQPFIGKTPEPASLALLGIGVLGVLGLRRKR